MNVLIIGGSSDIGLTLAKYLDNIGFNVIATYNNHKCNDSSIEYIKCDITKEIDIDNTFKYVIEKYHKIDVLINMAAIYNDDEITNLTKDDFMKVLEVNLVGTFLTIKTYQKYFNDGLIINIGSTDGIDTYNEYNITYATSKTALINMTKSLSLATTNKVICLCPNWLDSNSTNKTDKTYLDNELKRIGQTRLITLDEFNKSVEKIIKENIPTGSIIRLDIKGDKVCLEKMQ